MNAIEELEKYYISSPVGDAPRGGASSVEPGSAQRCSEPAAGDGDGDGISPGTDEQASSSAVEDDRFITHVLSKSDTLAGLAVQYNVAVSDIKRANGLMSENMMWSRGKLLIPRRSIPLTDEQQRQVAELVGQQDPIDSSRRRLKEHIRGAQARRTEGAAALDQLSSYYDLKDGGEWGQATAARQGAAEIELGVLDAGETSLLPSSAQDDRVRMRGRRAVDASEAHEGAMLDDAGPSLVAPFSSCLPSAAAHCMPPAGPGTSSRFMRSVRNAFADIMEPPADGGHASRSAPPRPPSAAAAPLSRPASGNMPRVRSSNGVSAFFSRLSSAAGQPALAGGGPSVAAIGQGLLAPRAPAAEPRAAHMRREGSAASVTASVKGAKGD